MTSINIENLSSINVENLHSLSINENWVISTSILVSPLTVFCFFPTEDLDNIFILNCYAGKLYVSGNFTPPPDMVFGEAQILSISVYVILFIIGLVFNSLSLKQLLEERIKRKVKSKMNLLLIHLAIADLMVREYTNASNESKMFFPQVILLQVPLEIIWTYTVSWAADDVTCRISVFFRILGCYLSGFVLIVISLDRLYAVVSPLAHRQMSRETHFKQDQKLETLRDKLY